MARLPALLLLVVTLVCGRAHAAMPSAEQAQMAARVHDLLRGIAGEYTEAFDADGRIVRPIELEEAGLLLAETRDLVAKLGIGATDVAGLEKAVADRKSGEVVTGLVRTLAARVTDATGVTGEELPAEVPSAPRGSMLFHENCTACHGADGRGDGEESRRLGLKPANFTDAAFMRGETPDDFFNVVTLGRRRSGMPAWGDALSVQERWDVIRFVWTLTQPAATVARGREQCRDCVEEALGPPAALTRTSDTALAERLESGPRRARLADLDDEAKWAIVAAIRARAFDGLVGGVSSTVEPRTRRSAREAFAEAHGLLDTAIAARGRGEPAAIGLATDAYMRFEPFEKRLGATDPGLVRRVEEGFVRLRQLVRAPGSDDEIGALVKTLHRDLDTAATAIEPGSGAWVRFVESAGIILREGFEVVLVVGALIAYVRRSGQPAMVRALYFGGAIGVAASVVTAAVLVTVLRVTPWAGEALEGGAMLLAAVVLFWVSYWLISKSEADRWQRYIHGKVQGALTTGNGTALAAAAFLAVYREGFETILFYQALFATAPAGDVMAPAGLLVGLVLLVIVYVGLERVGLRIPMGAFFAGTGAFLYAMAVVFAGRGVAELQAATLLPLTPVAWAPRVEVLGIFPTVESLVVQGLFVLLLGYAIGVTIVRRRAARATAADEAAPTVARKVTHG